MKFSLDITKHSSQLKAVISLAKLAKMPEYLSMIKFQIVGNDLLVSSTDLQMTLCSTLALASTDHVDATILIHFESIQQVLSVCSGVVDFDLKKNTATQDKITIFLQSLDAQSYPTIETPTIPDECLTWDDKEVKDLSHAFALALPFVGKDESRIRLCSVNFVCEDGTINMYSTNGHAATYQQLNKNLGKAQNFNCLIPSSAITHIQSFLSSTTYPAIFKQGSNLVFSDIHRSLAIRLLQEDFPDIHAVLPKKHSFDYKVTDDMKKALGQCKKVGGGDSTILLSLDEFNNFKLICTVKAQEVYQYNTLLADPIYTMRFQLDYLWHGFTNTDLAYHSLSEITPLVLQSSDTKTKMLVMPRRA